MDISPSMDEMPRRGRASGQNAEFGWDRVKLGRAERQADPRSIDESDVGTARANTMARDKEARTNFGLTSDVHDEKLTSSDMRDIGRDRSAFLRAGSANMSTSDCR